MTEEMITPTAPLNLQATAAINPQVGKYDPAKLNFGRRLHEAGFHPVLVFGTSESGKSMMLLSLLNYGAKDDRVAAKLSENRILPREDSNVEKYHSQASVFCTRDVSNFDSKELTHPTLRSDPLFIPVEIKSKEDDTSIKLAFLEGDGEWYKLNSVDDANRDRFQPIPELKTPIEQILNSYPDGLSIIFVCPSYESNVAKPVQLSRDSLAALIPMIGEKRRNISPTDNLLLMLSMWDGYYGPSDPHGHFHDASADVALEALGGRQSNLWAAFSRHVGIGGAAKAMMPYSAAWINNKTMLNNAAHKPTYDRFNRTVWNWIYGNATQSMTASPSEPLGQRKILFRDVLVPAPEPIRWYEWLTWYFIWSRVRDD